LASGSGVVQSMNSPVEVEQYLNETIQEAVIMAQNSLVVEQQAPSQIEYDA
jgi:competence CoiA-like predicted nuclease